MPNRKLPPNEVLSNLYDSGLSTKEIAEKFGVKPVTVCSLFRRIGKQMRSGSEAQLLRTSKPDFKASTYWKGKKQPDEMVEKRISKIRGKKHWLWKGGNSLRNYRKMVHKEICESCGSKSNLGIHHKDLNHFNDDPKNLQVLCVSCHMSLHKKAYWEAKRKGQKTPKSNGPVGWKK